MLIRPYLAGQAFDPELITNMSRALETVCDALRLKLADNAATRLIAEKIIGLAERGIRDGGTMASLILADLEPEPDKP